jgi:hypothetical protein
MLYFMKFRIFCIFFGIKKGNEIELKFYLLLGLEVKLGL